MKKDPYILYIDDDEEDCILFQEALTRNDPNVVLKFIDSGEKAIQFLSKAITTNDLPGVIILDMNMPGLDGRTTLIEIKKVLPSNMSVLFLTTTLRNTDVAFGERNGATLFVKPTSIAGYNDLISTILNIFF